jgi:RNA polymerase sigma-70 factor (ECF subfamily)
MNNGVLNRNEWITAVVGEFEDPLLRYAYSITGNLEQARDAVQDVFLRLWTADRSRIEARVGAWLFTACRNRALDFVRKERCQSRASKEHLANYAGSDSTPAREMETADLVHCLREWMTALPTNQREVLRLKFQGNLSYAEISEVTQLSVTNVGFLLHTAIKTLRRNLQAVEEPAWSQKGRG